MEATVLSGKVGPLKVHQHGPKAIGDPSSALCTVQLQPPSSSKRDRVTAAGCSSCGASVGLATASGAVYILHVKQRRYVLLDQHSREGTAVCIVSQPSRKLFVGFADGSIRCYDLATHSHIASLSGHGTSILSIAADGRGRLLVTASADKLLLWDAESFQQRRVLADLNFDRVMTAAADSGTLLAVAHASGHLTLLDAATKQLLVTSRTPCCKGQQHLVPSSIAFTPNRQQLLVACRAPPVLLVYDSPSLTLQQVLHVVGPGAGSLLQVQALPDSNSAAVLLSSGQVVCLDLAAAAVTLQVLLGSASGDARVNSFDCDTRGNLLVAACSDGQGRLFDLAALRKAAAAAGGAARQKPGQAAAAAAVAAAAEAARKARSKGALVGAVTSNQQQPQPLVVEALSLQQLAGLPGYGLTPLSQQAATGGSLAEDQAQEGEGGPPALQQLSQNVGPGMAGRRAVKEAGKGGQATAAGGAASGQVSSGQLKAQRVDLPASALNRAKLEQLLKRFGVFPHQQRALIWDGLLRLPHNSSAHAGLVDRGLHPAFQQLPALLQGTSGKLVGRLQAVLSQLAHWCPLFGEGGFAPRFCFPFIRVLGPNQVVAFEALATLLVNWGQGWFDLWPNPPVHLLRKFLAVLSHHDQQLGAHLTALQPAVLALLWAHASSALSDLLPAAADWGRAWDHILVQGPEFMYQVLMAWLVEVRGLLLAEGGAAGVERVLASQPAVDLGKVLDRAYQLQRATPTYMHLAPKPVSYLPAAPSSSVASSTAAGGSAAGGLPVYPLFTDYPAGCVEQQRLEREKVQAAEAALIRRRQVIAELEARSKQVAFESHALTAAREQLVALDAQRREAALAVEEALATAGAQLGDAAKAERLRQIRLVEEAYQKTLASLKAQWGPELASLKEETERRRRLMALTLKGLQEEEDIKALEFQAQQRLWALEQDQMAAAAKSSLQDAAAAATAALSAKQRAAAEQWQAEDRARELAARHEAARRAAVVAQAENSAAGQAATALLMQQELEAAHNLAKVEHARRLRQLAEDEVRLTAAQLELEREEAGLRAAAAAADAKRQAEGMTSWLSEQQRSRLAAIAAEQAALSGRQEALRAEVGQLAAAARLEQPAAGGLAALQQLVEGADEVEAAAAADLLRKLRRERHRHQQLQEDMQALRTGSAQAQDAAGAAAAAASLAGSPARRPGSAAAAAGAVQGGAGGRALERAAAAAAAAAAAVEAAAQARRVAAAAEETAAQLAAGDAPDLQEPSYDGGDQGWQAEEAAAAAAAAAAADRRQQAYQRHLEQEVEGHVAQLRGAAAAAAEVADRLHGRSPPRAAGLSSVPAESPGYARGPAGSGEGGLGSSYSSLLRGASAGRAASVTSGTSDLSAEVEALLAEAEAEVQREDSALREILAAAGLDAQVMGLAAAAGGGNSSVPAMSAPASSNNSSMGRMEGQAMAMRGAVTASGRGTHLAAAGSAKVPATTAARQGLSAAAGRGGTGMARTGAVVSTAPPGSTKSKAGLTKPTAASKPWAVPSAAAAGGGGLHPVPEEASDRSKSTPGSRHKASPARSAASSSAGSSIRQLKPQQQQRAASPASFHTASSTSAASSGSGSKAGRYAPGSPGRSSAVSSPAKPGQIKPLSGSLAGRQPGPAAAAGAAAARGRVGTTAAVAASSQRLLPGGLTLGHGVVGAPGSSQLGSPLNLSGTAGSSPSALSPVSNSSAGSSREGAAGGGGRGLYQPVLLGTSTVAATAGASSKGYSSSQSATAATTTTLSQLSADLSAAVAAATAAAATAAQRLGSSADPAGGASGPAAAGAGGQPRSSLGSSHSSGEPTLSVLSGGGGSVGHTSTSPDLWPLSSLAQGSNPGGGAGFLHNPLLAPPGGGSSQQQYSPGSRGGSTTSSGTSVSSLGLYLRKGSAAATAAAAAAAAASLGGGAAGAGAASSGEGLGSGGSGAGGGGVQGLAGVSVDSSAEVGGFRFAPSQASSTATSQELDSLLRQLSGAEQRLMAGAGRVAPLASSNAGQTSAAGAGGEGGLGWSSLDLGSSVTSGSLSWSQTLKVVEEAAGLTKG